ncbi:LOW QUALITY PROTEIN: cell death regulator Aven [Plectropomus leopardus]|uniref:LOW QUALITY PROTEIN: cell death regulator Aven n=1 Tax=Plectropomus leopardus TaxID=160734 RepID=UPI001C4B9D4A|nr:LOW QUALITY PROTEIN: cell death regulator Aven [Plectropomus leopardus]
MLNCPATLKVMEGRPSRGRGGSWRRGGRGGNDSDSGGGEHRGRGRGGHHRGRGKRDHHRGRGRGGSGYAAEYHHRDQDERDNFQEEDDRREVFSRRKLESNWDRYEASEKQKPEDDDTPTQRGTDYHVLLESAGDSFTQFRFSEEKDWEMDSFTAGQMSAAFVDLPALSQSLEQVPLHQRLNLDAELLQVSTPVELPTMTLTHKQEIPKTAKITPPSAAFKVTNTDQKVPVAANPASGSDSKVSSTAADLPIEDEGDEELDQLLSLQKPVSGVSRNQAISVSDEESAVSEKAYEEVKGAVPEAIEQKMEKEREGVTHLKPASVRQEMTEEDLEDWLDSMIS